MQDNKGQRGEPGQPGSARGTRTCRGIWSPVLHCKTAASGGRGGNPVTSRQRIMLSESP